MSDETPKNCYQQMTKKYNTGNRLDSDRAISSYRDWNLKNQNAIKNLPTVASLLEMFNIYYNPKERRCQRLALTIGPL